MADNDLELDAAGKGPSHHSDAPGGAWERLARKVIRV